MKRKKDEEVFRLMKASQYHAVEELINESKPTPVYYTLIILSSMIIACGILLGNASVVIGGMLVTPMLTPVLTVALSLSTGELKLLKFLGTPLIKSFGFILVSSFIIGLFFGAPKEVTFENTGRTIILYFIIAVVSGLAATFAWVRKESASVLPGVAIAVSLVPPISAVGIWLSVFYFETARFFFFVFLTNFFGIVIGSVVIFSLLKFYKTDKRIKEKSGEILEK